MLRQKEFPLSYPDLQSFVQALERAGQLKRVGAEVDPMLEVSAIADRMSKSLAPEGVAGAPRTDPIHGGTGGHGLLFERVKGVEPSSQSWQDCILTVVLHPH